MLFYSVRRIGDKRIKDLPRACSISAGRRRRSSTSTGWSSLELASNPPGTFAAAFERVNRAAINGRDCDLLGRTTMGPGCEERMLRSFTGLRHALFPARPRARDARRSEIRSLGPFVGREKKKDERNDLDVPRCGFYLKRPRMCAIGYRGNCKMIDSTSSQSSVLCDALWFQRRYNAQFRVTSAILKSFIVSFN